MRDFTEIVVVLDKSSSMYSIVGATISSFNEFVDDQSRIGDNANLSLYTFNEEVGKVFVNKPIKEVEKLDNKSYSPSGWTAMNDAIGIAIDELGEKLSKMSESERPNKVVFVIITDGEENKSRIFSTAQIREKIKHQKEKYNWQFLFLGANIDAVKTGDVYAIPANACLNFTHDAAGTSRGMSANSKALWGYRKGVATQCVYQEENQNEDSDSKLSQTT